MKTVFGPVPSRRLGRSLGIDVIPPKTCSYDCVYCESGRTTHLSVKRETFVSPDQVLNDLEVYFKAHPRGADVLTFSSAGEPTLYEPLGELIRSVKKRFNSFPVIVLTNGSLLWDAEVRRALAAADRVVPSLDAVTQSVFEKLNRPHPRLDLSAVLEGFEAFRREYRGQLHIEIMLAAGYNDDPQQWKAMRKVIDRLDPDCVELNTVVRPPAESGVCGLSVSRMEEAAKYFPREKTSIIGHFRSSAVISTESGLAERIAEMVQRRPCTVDEMAISLSVSGEDLLRSVTELVRSGRLERSLFGNKEYFRTPSCGRSTKE